MTTKARVVLLAAIFAVLIISVSYAALFLGSIEKREEPKLPINVACVGDSITEWSGYTVDLQAMLGDNYVVGNFGVAGATVSKAWSKPYTSQPAFQESKQFLPDVVIIMLGTNDAHTYQTTQGFAQDYETLVADYQALPGEQQIIIVAPPPIYDNDLELSDANLKQGVIPLIQKVADNMSLPVLDVNMAMTDHPEYFVDGVHPNSDGALTIATEVNEAITFEDYAAGPPSFAG
jgi:lysophospholipase L1-like esterase